MKWNWQLPDWTDFTYDKTRLALYEPLFYEFVGRIQGATQYLHNTDKQALQIDIFGAEAIENSAIEGEILDRDSVRSSLCQQFGFYANKHKIPDREYGISLIMHDLYNHYQDDLTHDILHTWQRVLCQHNTRILSGAYRIHTEPMQIVSGSYHNRQVHFEAPPSAQVKTEMDKFLNWFNDYDTIISPVVYAGISHLYFETIHPFEDGNGRIGRALVEKALARHMGKPSFIMLSYTINQDKKTYYNMLHRASTTNNVTHWLVYFYKIIHQAQQNTIRHIEFIINKTKFFDKHTIHLNLRQQKALSRMFEAGIDGFKGGLSTANYIKITKTTRPTATRDLSDLVKKQALIKTGKGKYTRYWLRF